MAAKGPRENIILESTEYKNRNYTTSKNKRNNPRFRRRKRIWNSTWVNRWNQKNY